MNTLIDWLQSFGQQVPVTWFVFVGSILEEVVAPIPSPLVMTLAGSIAASQGQTLFFLVLLALVGALSKTIGSYIIYVISDKAEDVVIDKFGKFLGVTHSDTEGLGRFFSKGRRDDIAIFLLRALPIMPTAPVSVIAGLIKINLRTYLISTFLGLIIRNLVYLYLGYVSLGSLESLSNKFDSLEKVGYFVLSVIAGFALLVLYRKQDKGSFLKIIEKSWDSFTKKR